MKVLIRAILNVKKKADLMTVDNDFKWKKLGLTSMQETKTWIFSMIVVVKKERKKNYTHQK